MGSFRAVKAMSNTDIERVASDLRTIFGMKANKSVPIGRLVETVLPELLPGYDFLVLPDEDMPGVAGLTTVGEYTIYLCNTTYVALCDGDPEARHVAAHELGHLVLHSAQSPAHAKRVLGDDHVDPEWQADRFADAWLMPREGVLLCRSARHVAAKYNVTDEVAERRFVEVKLGDKIQGELF